MCTFLVLLPLFGFIFQEIPKIPDPDPPLSLKLKDGGIVFVESNRQIIFMINKEGAIKWISRELTKKGNLRVMKLHDVVGPNDPGGWPVDHVFVSANSATSKEHSKTFMFALKDGKCTFMGSD